MTQIWAKPAETAAPQGANEAPPRDALVVFCDQTGVWWLRILRRGFRHCFVMVQFETGWVLYNPLSNGTQIDLWTGVSEDALWTWLEAQGFRCVRTRVHGVQGRAWPWRPFTCVEAVKRTLGLNAPWVVTPWSLFRALQKQIGKKALTFTTG